ncbi:LysR family transcriptional regulator [Pseudomonadota bacterium AL_CKDN230030165-1A_HGKHYDSX7]
MDQIAALKLFVRIVETGSLSRGAAQVGMPKSSASKLLAQLERHLGVPLIGRSTRVSQLTKEGAEYYRDVTELLARLGSIDAELGARGSSLRGRLRIDVPSSLANAVLIPILGEFRALYPDIQLLVGVGDRPISLIEEAADCVIRVGELPDASFIARVLFEDTLVTCASPDYLARRGSPETPQALAADHDLVGYFSARTGEPVPLVFRQGDEIRRIDTMRLLSNDSTGQVSMLLAGLGIGQAYGLAIREPLAQGRLVRVLAGWQTASVPVSLVYPAAAKQNKRARVFIDWALERLGQIGKSGA